MRTPTWWIDAFLDRIRDDEYQRGWLDGHGVALIRVRLAINELFGEERSFTRRTIQRVLDEEAAHYAHPD